MGGGSMYYLHQVRSLCAFLCMCKIHTTECTYSFKKEELGYGTRQLSANTYIGFLLHI